MRLIYASSIIVNKAIKDFSFSLRVNSIVTIVRIKELNNYYNGIKWVKCVIG